MPEQNKFLSIFLLIILAIIWGTSFILVKRGLEVFSADEVGSLRIVAAAIFLIPPALIRLKEVKKSKFGKLLLTGLMGSFFPAFLFAIAQTRLESSLAGIMNGLTPIFTVLVGALFFNLKTTSRIMIGVVIGFAGSVLLIMAGSGGQMSNFNYYALFIIVASMLYGINLNFIKFQLPDLKALTITSWSVVLVGPFAAVYLFGFTDFIGKMQTAPDAWKAMGMIVLLGIMSTSLALILFNKLVKMATPLYASSVTYLIPIVAVIWGVWDGETLLIGHYIGMAAIISGVYLANRK
ncbi:MAG TPA: DMT family transporter [Cyclobacteriaceae bacterium]|nr:DMT family transporter [Cyclobacteriaceae bacterium]